MSFLGDGGGWQQSDAGSGGSTPGEQLRHAAEALLAEPELAWLTDRIGLRPSALGACVPPPPRTSDVGGGSGEDELQGWKRRRVAAGSGSLLAWEDPSGRLVATRPSKKRRGGRGARAAA